MHDITNNLAPQNILRVFTSYSTLLIKYTLITDYRSFSKGDYEIKFSRLDKQGKSFFSEWGPKCGITNLRVLENSKSIALKRKHMIALILQILSQTDYYPATYSQSSVTHPLIIFAIVF